MATTDLTLRWARRERAVSGEVAVVVDILRASTTITACFHCGAERVLPTIEVADAFRLGREHHALLMGERDSVVVPGFDMGNSPCDVTPERVAGQTIVFSSTSFPIAAAVAAPARAALVGCFLNLRAVTDEALRLAGEGGCGICFVLAGAPDNPADEDRAFAGLAGRRLLELGCTPDGAVREAIEFVGDAGWEVRVRAAFHAERLTGLGFGGDVEFACRLDAFNVVPVLMGGELVRLGA